MTKAFSNRKLLGIAAAAALLLLMMLGMYLRPKTLPSLLRAEEETFRVVSCTTVGYGETTEPVDGPALLDGLDRLSLYGPFPHSGTFLNVEKTVYLNLSFLDRSGNQAWTFVTLTVTEEKTYLQMNRNMYIVGSDLF